ncbi:hypothetical protein Pfo_028041 [Paulownia fortunei]|nr:hypothetical protein Pfo_028041 [Paulownia fortunei]
MKSKRRFCIKRKSFGSGNSSRLCCKEKVKLNHYNSYSTAKSSSNWRKHRMVWEQSLSTPHHPSPTATPKFSTSFANRIFSDVAGDITIIVDENRFYCTREKLFYSIEFFVWDDEGSYYSGCYLACRLELERRIAYRLEMALLDDLLIPSVQTGLKKKNEESGYESKDGVYSLLKVGRLIDAYLAEIAPDPYLSLPKFIAMIEAIDIYLKAHPMLNEHECKKLCKLMDCQKLSQEACNHAAQNDRLPVHLVVRVLYFEQLRLKNALSGSCGDGLLLSQKMSSGVASAAMSPEILMLR